MVFSSLPIYLDPPNWQQHLNQQQTNGNHESPELILQPQQANGNHENPEMIQPQQANGNHENSQLIIQPQQDQQSHQPPPNHMAPNFTSSGSRDGTGGGHVGGSNSTANTLFRHNSLAERGRVVKNIAAQPEGAPLKCPRCESINTKFCYFNNYNLSQPRHFCKTCRRYWTRGGALRNVPVGGGCRRNKRSKSNQSKSNPSTGIIGPTAIGIGIGIGINNTTICRFTSTSMTTSEGIMLTSMGTGSGSLSSTAGRHHSTTTPHLSLMATSLQNMSTQLGMGNLGHSFPAGTLQPQGHHQLATKMTVTSSPDHNLQDHQFGTSGPLYLSMQLQQTNHQFPFMAAAGYHHEAVPSAPAVSVLYPFQNDHEGCDASIYASSRGRNHDDQLNMVRSKYKGTTTSGALLTDQNACSGENGELQLSEETVLGHVSWN